MGDVLPDNIWRTALTRIHKHSKNSHHRLIQFKVIHRKNSINQCLQDVTHVKTVRHFYVYLGVVLLFIGFVPIFSFFFLAFMLFRQEKCSQSSLDLPVSVQNALLMGTVIAKRLFHKEWKISSSPSFKSWLYELVSGINLENLRLANCDCGKEWKVYRTIWVVTDDCYLL